MGRAPRALKLLIAPLLGVGPGAWADGTSAAALPVGPSPQATQSPPHDSARAARGGGARQKRRGDGTPPPLKEGVRAVEDGGPWPKGVVYYRWKPNADSLAKEVTAAAMATWEHRTCVRFEEVSETCSDTYWGPRCHPVVMGSDEEDCASHVGYMGSAFQAYNLGKKCQDVGTAMHELGHMLGLSHEHERTDRDEYVEPVLSNVVETWQRYFKIKPWRSEETQKLPYDLSSIMHYDPWAYARSSNVSDPSTATLRVKNKDAWGNCKIGQRASLSIGDIITVGAIYGCSNVFCADRDRRCEQYAEEGHCPGSGSGKFEHFYWMEMNCAATCGLCECRDKSADCAPLVEKRHCPHQSGGSAAQRLWMKHNCAKSCGLCSPSDLSCQDLGPQCSSIEQRLFKGKPYCDYESIQRTCPRTCRVCTEQVFC